MGRCAAACLTHGWEGAEGTGGGGEGLFVGDVVKERLVGMGVFISYLFIIIYFHMNIFFAFFVCLSY